ncbi:MAG: outer membrane beta-barrel protein [Casimicrobium sp.]
MKRIFTTSRATALFVAFAALPASAQWYVGTNVGRTDISFNNANQADQFLELGFDSAATTSDTKGTGARILGGYQLHKYAAVEAAYVDLGKFSFRTNVTPAGTLAATTKINGFELAAVGTFPIGDRFGIFARVGALIGETKTRYTGSGSVEIITDRDTQKKRSTQLSYGAGATFNVSKRFGIRAEWSRYSKLGDDFTGGKTDADFYGAGLVYRF